MLEGDITACFDEISHVGPPGPGAGRIGDKRVLGLVKAFLKAGVLAEDGAERDTVTGTPQGGILSPLLANVALSVLDEHFAEAWKAMGDSNARSIGGARDWPPTASCVKGQQDPRAGGHENRAVVATSSARPRPPDLNGS